MVALVGGTGSIPSATGAYVDCTLCHLDPDPGSAAKDYFEYFAEPARQHPVRIAYPYSPNSGFNTPTGRVGGIAFFDANGNGIVDPEEIQLFGANDQVECSSCHAEHADGSPPPAQPNMYLRVANNADALCRVCHEL